MYQIHIPYKAIAVISSGYLKVLFNFLHIFTSVPFYHLIFHERPFPLQTWQRTCLLYYHLNLSLFVRRLSFDRGYRFGLLLFPARILVIAIRNLLDSCTSRQCQEVLIGRNSALPHHFWVRPLRIDRSFVT